MCRWSDRLSGNANRVNGTSEKCPNLYSSTCIHRMDKHTHTYIHACMHVRDMWVSAFMRRHYAFLAFSLHVASYIALNEQRSLYSFRLKRSLMAFEWDAKKLGRIRFLIKSVFDYTYSRLEQQHFLRKTTPTKLKRNTEKKSEREKRKKRTPKENKEIRFIFV